MIIDRIKLKYSEKNLALSGEKLTRLWDSQEQHLHVFGNKFLRKTFRFKRGKTSGHFRILHNVELYNLYRSSNISRIAKSRRL